MTLHSPNLRIANLNLMPILRELLREGSVSKAAANIGLSPSAVSCALSDLRHLFGDPLLVRVGQTMRLTPRAERLSGKLEQACRAMESLMREDAFDPASVRHVFVIAAPDYLALLLCAPLMKRLRAAAPDVGLRFVDVPGDLDRRLNRGDIDLGLADVLHLHWEGASMGPAYADRLIGIMRAGHPLTRRRAPNQKDLARYPFATWDPGPDVAARASGELLRAAAPPQPPVLLQSINALPMAVMDSDLIAAAPLALARRAAKYFPLKTFELPGPPVEIESAAHWSALRDSDPAHQWFREIVQEELARCHDL